MEEGLMKKIVSVFPNLPQKHEDLLRDISNIAYRKNLVTIYNADSTETEDIDHSILLALLKASNLRSSSQLKLALIWNRVDIAKEAIFSGSKTWDVKEIENALELALMKNRVDFVKLLLEHVCVIGFLTTSRLERLYNAKDDDTFTTFSVLMAKRYPTDSKTGQQAKVSLYQVGLLLEQIIGNGFRTTYTLRIDNANGKEKKGCLCCRKKTPSDRGTLMTAMYDDHIGCSNNTIASPLTDLFIWAVLTCKYDMAYLLWQRGIEALAKAIVAFHLNTSMASIARERYNSDAANALQKQAEFYRVKSIDLLTQSFEDDQLYTRLLLCAELQNWSSMTCLSMAARFHHIGFIAHPAVQFLLNDQWYGIFRFTASLKGLVCWLCCCTSGSTEDDTSTTILNSAYAYSTRHAVSRRWSFAPNYNGRKSKRDHNHSIAPSSASWRRQSLVPGGTMSDALDYSTHEKLLLVATAPVVKFWLNAFFFFAFLALFSYVVMTQMTQQISIAEWIVVATVLSLTTEEIRQIVMAGDSEGLSLAKKLKRWSSESWNLVDLLGVLCFFAGFAARNLETEEIPFWGRIFYALDIIIWYLRVLDILSVKNFMGPYVNMVGRMLWDTVTFTVLLFVFVTAYGVASRAILHPNKELSLNSAEEIFSYPYWQIFGELFMEEILPDCSVDTPLGQHCETAYAVVLLIMAVYLLIANVLLLNLLIAIFNNTFSKVIENANEIWKFHRYELIMEYSERPCLPPPLTLIMHVSMMIRWLVYSVCNVKAKKNTMKIELDDDAIQLLRTFEDECVENYLRQQSLHEQASLAGMVQRTSDRMDSNVSHLEQLQMSEADTRRRLKMLGST
nr:transient receptor potential cation channel subfamily M member 1-1 [Apostichopus japonicus]